MKNKKTDPVEPRVTKDAPAPDALQGHEEEEAWISTIAGLIQVLARIDARVNAKESARA